MTDLPASLKYLVEVILGIVVVLYTFNPKRKKSGGIILEHLT